MRWDYCAFFVDGIELLEALWIGILRAAWAGRYEQPRSTTKTVDAVLAVEMKLTRIESH